ncbi:2-C-methyl-D-erythritol 4-phosphate cytidylyltransferase [Actinomycetaceae bacterium TAE3-ERU4]|nr:2-C-methyl-D-erythritol 4-phosphate cytidylyltransferase [Actinomycetaceae bacterium TAE3-ERU4]
MWAVVTAAGSGTRLGAQVPKALVEVDGVPALVRVLKTLAEVPELDGVVITCPQESQELFESAVPVRLPYRVHVVPGGPSRQSSVYEGLKIVEQVDSRALVLIHDAARCLAPAKVFNRVISHLREGAVGVVTALPVKDTIKIVVPTENPGELERVSQTPLRSNLRAVQTPQGFDLERLMAAHRVALELGKDESCAAPDDASLMESQDYPVRICEGDEQSFKITTALDLQLANLLAKDIPVEVDQLPFGPKGDDVV